MTTAQAGRKSPELEGSACYYRVNGGVPMRKTLLAAALLGLSLPGAAFAAAYDGSWRVTVVTEQGTCDRAYGYDVAVSNGQVRYSGEASISLAGTVTPSGHVKVSVSKGNQRADGTGRLAANAGRGTWRGSGSAGSCAGYWEAERR
jgi:hypothetical protein